MYLKAKDLIKILEQEPEKDVTLILDNTASETEMWLYRISAHTGFTCNEISFEIKELPGLDPADSFFKRERQIEVLMEQYVKHGKIIVAFDFDDTINPFRGGTCDKVRQLVRDLRPYAHLICFTARTPENLPEAIEVMEEMNIPYDYINKEWTGKEIKGKLFYNQLLDDKAGLYDSYRILIGFLERVRRICE